MSGINTPVEVRISLGRTGGGVVSPSITIMDRVSHTVIASVDITALDFSELLASGVVVAMTNLPSEEQYRKVGKRMEIKKIPAEQFAHLGNRRSMGVRPKGSYSYGPSEEMSQYGDDRRLSEGYDEYQWSYHNYGWDLTLRRWVPTTEQERIDRADRYFSGL